MLKSQSSPFLRRKAEAILLLLKRHLPEKREQVGDDINESKRAEQSNEARKKPKKTSGGGKPRKKRSWIWFSLYLKKAKSYLTVVKWGNSGETIARLSCEFLNILGAVNLRNSLLVMEEHGERRGKVSKVSEFREDGKRVSLESVDYWSSQIEMSKSLSLRFVYSRESGGRSSDFKRRCISVRSMDRKRNRWERLPSCQEEKNTAPREYCMCCYRRERLLIISLRDSLH